MKKWVSDGSGQKRVERAFMDAVHGKLRLLNDGAHRQTAQKIVSEVREWTIGEQLYRAQHRRALLLRRLLSGDKCNDHLHGGLHSSESELLGSLQSL